MNRDCARVGARQCRYDFGFWITFNREIFPGVNDQIELPIQQSFAKVLREDSLLRHLPQWIALVFVAERFVKGIVDFDLRMCRAESLTNLVRLNSGQVTATRRDRHAHKSSHPNGRNCACWDWSRTNCLISARAASTCPANLSRSARSASKSSCNLITGVGKVIGSVAASPRRSRHFVNDALCIRDQRATPTAFSGAAITNPASACSQPLSPSIY